MIYIGYSHPAAPVHQSLCSSCTRRQFWLGAQVLQRANLEKFRDNFLPEEIIYSDLKLITVHSQFRTSYADHSTTVVLATESAVLTT